MSQHVSTSATVLWPPAQQPSGMPLHRYRPFHQQIVVDLPDRTWPTRRIVSARRSWDDQGEKEVRPPQPHAFAEA